MSVDTGPKSPVQIFLARVEAYDSTGSVTRVRLQNEKCFDAQVCSGLLNVGRDGDVVTGAGISVGPEVNALCLVARTTNGEWYILGFVAPFDGRPNKFTILKEVRNQGDIALSTRDGNSVKVLAGGQTDIRATAMTATSYMPDTELIHNTCRNFIIDTNVGSLQWVLNRKNQTGSAVFKVNSSLEEESPQAILSMGHNPSGNVFEATVSTSPKSRFVINRQGVVRIESEKDVNIVADEKKGNVRVNGRMIYLNSGSSGAVPSSQFPGNAPQVDPVTPSLPTPSAVFAGFGGIPSSLSSPASKRQLNESTFVEPTTPLDLVET